jgi:hypothetical protein
VVEFERVLAVSDPALLTAGPQIVSDAWWPLRTVAAFLVVLGLGGVLIRRCGPLLHRSIDASRDRPLSSLGYGLAAHAVIAFGAVYLADKFGRWALVGGAGPLIGPLVGALLALGAAAIGFTVVGATIVELRGDRHLGFGLLLGSALAGATAATATLASAFVWFVVVSMGVGGAVRRWLHASAASEY